MTQKLNVKTNRVTVILPHQRNSMNSDFLVVISHRMCINFLSKDICSIKNKYFLIIIKERPY